MFKRKTVDGIMAALHRTIDNLESLAETSYDKAEAKRAKATDLTSAAKALEAEGDRAVAQASKLNKLLA